MLSAPAIFISMTVKGFLIGTQRARISLYLDLFLNALNTVLTVTLVFGLGWGVAGAATGNLIAEWGAAVAGGYMAGLPDPPGPRGSHSSTRWILAPWELP